MSTYVLFGTPSLDTATVPGAPRVEVAMAACGELCSIRSVGGELSSPQKFTKSTLSIGAVHPSPHCLRNMDAPPPSRQLQEETCGEA
jgi:hypothetical protein